MPQPRTKHNRPTANFGLVSNYPFELNSQHIERKNDKAAVISKDVESSVGMKLYFESTSNPDTVFVRFKRLNGSVFLFSQFIRDHIQTFKKSYIKLD